MMKMYRLFAPLLVGAALLAACAAPSPAATAPTVTIPQVTVPAAPAGAATPAPNDAPIQPPEAALAAQQELATQLNVKPEEITIAKVEEVQWTDSCLGAGGPAESCLQVITPGFSVVLTFGGQAYVYHTNADGSVLRMATQQPLPGAGQGPTQSGEAAIAQAVINALAAQLKVDPGTIKISSIEQQDFSDACLGFGRADESCLQAITPGYAMELVVKNKTYQIHSTMNGSSVRLSDGSELLLTTGSLTKTALVFRTGSQNCQEIQASLTSISTGPCGGPFQSVNWPAPQRVQELEVLLQAFQQSEIQGPAGSLTINGEGGRIPTEMEKASLLAWGTHLMQELAAGKPLLDTGQVFRYHRSGGIAGLCEEVMVFESGFAWNLSCKNDSPNITGVVRLNAQQFEAVKKWQENLASFDVEHKDQANADGMTTRLAFAGNGSKEASEKDQEDMIALAVVLFRTAGQV